MNPEIKQKWVAALRSGNYRQGKGKLRTHDDRFCCLGVLCDIAEREGIVVAERDEDFAERYPELNVDWDYDDTETELPLSIVNWADLPDRNPMLATDSCIQLNDEMEFTFDQIADEIERHL